jgi:hypothetical protein
MKTFVTGNNDYYIYRAGAEYLCPIAEFAVRTNYMRHMANGSTMQIEEKIESVYLEELAFFPEPQIYTVENKRKNMIGCI